MNRQGNKTELPGCDKETDVFPFTNNGGIIKRQAMSPSTTITVHYEENHTVWQHEFITAVTFSSEESTTVVCFWPKVTQCHYGFYMWRHLSITIPNRATQYISLIAGIYNTNIITSLYNTSISSLFKYYFKLSPAIFTTTKNVKLPYLKN